MQKNRDCKNRADNPRAPIPRVLVCCGSGFKQPRNARVERKNELARKAYFWLRLWNGGGLGSGSWLGVELGVQLGVELGVELGLFSIVGALARSGSNCCNCKPRKDKKMRNIRSILIMYLLTSGLFKIVSFML
jgi:hypothetical protein